MNAAGGEFGARSTTDEVLSGIDLTGRTVLVTGASTGLGLETARALHARGARVILAARSVDKLAAAKTKLRDRGGDNRVDTLELDLSDLDAVRRAADEANARFPTLDVLVNNAGVMACPLARTSSGLEWQLGVNHVGHFLFTCRLVPTLRRAGIARIVNLSSAGHKYASIDFDDVSFERRPYDKWLAYGQSKTANALFAVASTARLSRFGITANAVHPGAIATELGRHLTSAISNASRRAPRAPDARSLSNRFPPEPPHRSGRRRPLHSTVVEACTSKTVGSHRRRPRRATRPGTSGTRSTQRSPSASGRCRRSSSASGSTSSEPLNARSASRSPRISRASASIKSAADRERASRTPCPAQSERNSARPCAAAAARSGRVEAFWNGYGRIGSSSRSVSTSRMNRFTTPACGAPREGARDARLVFPRGEHRGAIGRGRARLVSSQERRAHLRRDRAESERGDNPATVHDAARGDHGTFTASTTCGTSAIVPICDRTRVARNVPRCPPASLP